MKNKTETDVVTIDSPDTMFSAQPNQVLTVRCSPQDWTPTRAAVWIDNDGEIHIADDAGIDELRSAVIYMATVIVRQMKAVAPTPGQP